MTKEDIVNYVMNTPHNSNPAVLRSMLNSVDSGGGSLIVNIVLKTGTNDTLILDKTWNEINNALQSGKAVYAKHEYCDTGWYDDISLIGIWTVTGVKPSKSIPDTDEDEFNSVCFDFHNGTPRNFNAVDTVPGSGDGRDDYPELYIGD